MDSIYDTLAGHYKMKHGVVSDDFNEDNIHKDYLKKKKEPHPIPIFDALFLNKRKKKWKE